MRQGFLDSGDLLGVLLVRLALKHDLYFAQLPPGKHVDVTPC